jgi:hypothetical protein
MERTGLLSGVDWSSMSSFAGPLRAQCALRFRYLPAIGDSIPTCSIRRPPFGGRLEPHVGIEPTTPRLQGERSTTELMRRPEHGTGYGEAAQFPLVSEGLDQVRIWTRLCLRRKDMTPITVWGAGH